MPDWTDIKGLAALMERREREIAALQQAKAAAETRLTAIEQRLLELEKKIKKDVLP